MLDDLLIDGHGFFDRLSRRRRLEIYETGRLDRDRRRCRYLLTPRQPNFRGRLRSHLLFELVGKNDEREFFGFSRRNLLGLDVVWWRDDVQLRASPGSGLRLARVGDASGLIG